MRIVDSLKRFNYWSRKVDKNNISSVQAVLLPKSAVLDNQAATSSCGQGSCNCGTGCNGECGGE